MKFFLSIFRVCLFRRLKSPKKISNKKKELTDKRILLKIEEKEELSKFKNPVAQQAWKEYKNDTHHSKSHFLAQRERILGGVADITKRYNLLNSKVAALKALHRRSTNSEVLLAILPTLQAKIAQNDDQNDEDIKMWTGEKTVEEIIMSGEEFNYQVKCSQLSPFMTKYAAKLFTPHDTVVSQKLNLSPPKFPSIKSASDLKTSDKLSKSKRNVKLPLVKEKSIKYRSSSIESPKIVTMEENAQEMPCMCGKCLVEFWQKNNIPEKYLKKLTDFTTHQEKSPVKAKYKRFASERKGEGIRPGLVPEDNLRAKTMFNEIYCEKIKDHLKKVEQEYGKSEENYRKYKEDEEKEKLLKREVHKEKKQNNDNEFDDIEEFMKQNTQPDMSKFKKKIPEGKRKMQLMSTIKKLESRYRDKYAIYESAKKEKERQRMYKFMDFLKEKNEQTHKELRNVEMLERKLTYFSP